MKMDLKISRISGPTWVQKKRQRFEVANDTELNSQENLDALKKAKISETPAKYSVFNNFGQTTSILSFL